MEKTPRKRRAAKVLALALFIAAWVGVAAFLAARGRRPPPWRAARAAGDGDIRGQLKLVLAADEQRRRRDGERALLEQGAILISTLRATLSELELDPRGKPVATDRWRIASNDVGAFRGRLALWFDDDSEVARACDAVVELTDPSTSWLVEQRAGARRIRVADGKGIPTSTMAPALTLQDLDERRRRYEAAARAVLLATA